MEWMSFWTLYFKFVNFYWIFFSRSSVVAVFLCILDGCYVFKLCHLCFNLHLAQTNFHFLFSTKGNHHSHCMPFIAIRFKNCAYPIPFNVLRIHKKRENNLSTHVYSKRKKLFSGRFIFFFVSRIFMFQHIKLWW